MSILVIILAIIGLIAVGVIWFFVRKYLKRQAMLRLLNLRLLSVKVPQKFSKEDSAKDALAEINLFSQLISASAALKSAWSFEISVANVGEDIHFYIAVPAESVEFMIRQVQGLWPDAQVEKVDDYTVFTPSGAVEVAFFRQKEHFALPIRTYLDAQLDTFGSILSNFSKIQAVGEGLALQVVIKQAPNTAKGLVLGYLSAMRKGISLKDALKGVRTEKKKEEKDYQPPVVDQEAMKILEEKISKPLFLVNVRIVASAPTPYRASELLESVAGSFSQFSAPQRNELKAVKPRRIQAHLQEFIFRDFQRGYAMTLSTDEISSFIHFPTSATEVPRLKWLKAREIGAPTDLPTTGTQLGENVFRGEARPIYMTEEDRRRHFYLIGQTGTGKSSLIINMALADIRAGKGVAVIDPHGDLIQSLLGLIPVERQQDVIVFDPGDVNQPVGLNMLENDPNRLEEKTFIVNEVQGIFNKLFTAETMGPVFEQYMRNALLLLMEDRDEPATFMEVPRVFTDVEFRKRKLAKASNPTVIDFWEKEAIKAGGEASLANITPYITSKFNNFIANDYVRPIIGQPRSSFRFRPVMDEGKILLVNLSKGRIGDINAGLLGMVVVGKLLMAAFSRIDIPQEQRRDYNLYIDEFQNFTTDSIATILSEARKYRLDLVIAHQFIGQLTEKIRDAVFGNVGSMMVFRIGAQDAEFVIKQFEPHLTVNDLINVDNFNAYVKLLMNGQTSKPFSLRTLPNPPMNSEQIETLREFSRQTYGRKREEVEADILQRLRR